MAAIQLGFTLRTSTNVKTVHLLGSWDNYAGQLPLSKDASKAGSWKGTFRFQGATLTAGKRYWYYYIMDGYHVSHDPAKPFTKEPTTGRSLNILDVPSSGAAAAPAKRTSEVPVGRGLSPSRIVSPKPTKAYASRKVREADYNEAPMMDELVEKFEQTSMYSHRYSASPPSSVGSSLSSRSGGSSPSSLSSLSDRSASSCRCNRYGITRKGDKVLLDCGGSRCGYSDDSSSCNSSDDSEDDRPVYKEIKPRAAAARAAPVAASRRR